MRLKNVVYEEIKRQAVDVLIESNVCAIPIDPFEIAYRLGLSIAPYSELDDKSNRLSNVPDGFSRWDEKGEWIICYNDQKRRERVRFTIAHEIGHYSLGHCHIGKEEESEANFFAGYLLAPPPLIYNTIDNPSTHNISNMFELSKEASENAYHRYIEWLIYGGVYKGYETKLLELFNRNIKVK